MPATAKKYRPLLFSERVEPNDLGQFDLCRAASLAMGIDAATNGEWTTNANGSRWGRGKIKKALERMRAATGEEERGSYNQGHMDAFLRGVKFPIKAYKRFNVPFVGIKEALKNDWVVFLAGDVDGTPPASPLRKYVNPNVGHEIILTRLNADGTRIAFIDPMTPHGVAKYQRWAPASDFRDFGRIFKTGGNFIAGKMKRGEYTQAQAIARDRARVIVDLQERFLELQGLWEAQQRELIAQDEEIETLRARIEELLADTAVTPEEVALLREIAQDLKEMSQEMSAIFDPPADV